MPPQHFTPITSYRTEDGELVPAMAYKGFKIKRQNEHVLFYIEPPASGRLPAVLQGQFTKIETLDEQIDRWLAEHPGMSAASLAAVRQGDETK